MQRAVGATPAAAESILQLAAQAKSTTQDDVLTHVVYASLLMHPEPPAPHEVRFHHSTVLMKFSCFLWRVVRNALLCTQNQMFPGEAEIQQK